MSGLLRHVLRHGPTSSALGVWHVSIIILRCQRGPGGRLRRQGQTKAQAFAAICSSNMVSVDVNIWQKLQQQTLGNLKHVKYFTIISKYFLPNETDLYHSINNTWTDPDCPGHASDPLDLAQVLNLDWPQWLLDWTLEHDRAGGNPLFLTLSSRPVSSRRNLLRTGRQEDLIMSGDGSRWWLVTPVSARCRGSLQNGARVRIGSSQYPTPLVREHWCSILPKLLKCFYFSKLKWNLYLLIKIQAGSSEMFQFHWLQSWIHLSAYQVIL